MAESREDAQAETVEGAPIESEADARDTFIDEVPAAVATASQSPLTASSWGPPQLEGYTVHGPGLDDRPRLSWTARHAGADLYFIDVRFAGEPRQTIGPIPAGDVLPHMAMREARARRAYDEVAARFCASPSIEVGPATLAAAEAPWPPVITMPAAPPRAAPPAPAAEPVRGQLETVAQPATTDTPSERSEVAPPAPSIVATADAPVTTATEKAESAAELRATAAPPPPAEPAATATTDDTASADIPPAAAAPAASALPAVTGARGMLMQSITRASQLLHAPKLSLRVIRSQTTTAARPPPTQDLESGKSAGPPAPSPEPDPAAPAHAATPKSDDLVLRDIDELLARHP